jgi:hypothetical protein
MALSGGSRVRSRVGDRSKSGLVVVKMSFVDDDPKRTS